MDKELVSIVVPVYKVEECIEKCIKSILNQTYKNLEIILVDDGSPDNSGKICDNYAKEDARIIVIHKQNGGLSDARNSGIRLAKGKYIGFIDSDDYIEQDMIEVLYNITKKYNADISMVSYREIENGIIINDNANYTNEIIEYSNVEAIKELLKDNIIKNYAWNKLYKTELFKEIEYPFGASYEDVGTTYKLFEKANKIVWNNVPKYNYIRRGNSIVSKNTYKNLNDFIRLSYERYVYFENSEYNKLIKKENDYSFIRNMLMFYLNYKTDEIEELDEVFNELYPVFDKIMKENYQDMIIEMSNQNLIATIYYLMQWDRKRAGKILKLIMDERRNKKECENSDI